MTNERNAKSEQITLFNMQIDKKKGATELKPHILAAIHIFPAKKS